MLHSIQDYLKRINSKISILDIMSIFTTLIIILNFAVFLYIKRHKNNNIVSYIKNTENIPNQKVNNTDNLISNPFASFKGKTYTFSWCKGSSNISSKNKIYFSNETEAISSGRTLSKNCKK